MTKNKLTKYLSVKVEKNKYEKRNKYNFYSNWLCILNNSFTLAVYWRINIDTAIHATIYYCSVCWFLREKPF